MKNLIKKQDEELDDKQLLLLKHLVLGNALELYKGGKQAQVVIEEMQKFIKKEIVAKIRKEAVEYIIDRMTEEERLCEGWSDGYNARIDEEKEIKQQILKELL